MNAYVLSMDNPGAVEYVARVAQQVHEFKGWENPKTGYLLGREAVEFFDNFWIHKCVAHEFTKIQQKIGADRVIVFFCDGVNCLPEYPIAKITEAHLTL